MQRMGCVCSCVCVRVFMFVFSPREEVGKRGRLSNPEPPSLLQFASANGTAGAALFSMMVLVTEGI